MSEPRSSRDPRDELIDRLRADNQRLRAENEDLTGRLARLERLISRNSGNSSMPPSLDDLPGRTPPAPRPPGDSKRGKGKQKGAPGAALSPVEHPDRRVPAYPERCVGCQAGLDPLVHEAAGMLARQQTGIPLVTATVTEYQLHSLRCGCGHVTRAELPAGVADAPISIGPNLQTLAVYLLFSGGHPVRWRPDPRVCAAQKLIEVMLVAATGVVQRQRAACHLRLDDALS